MGQIVYVNGRYRRYRAACVHVEDRGLQFADSVYEACEIAGGHVVEWDRHHARLERSLQEIRLAAPVSGAALRVIAREVVQRNRLVDGMVYIQMTRGVARRYHGFPVPAPPGGLIVMARARPRLADTASVIIVPDERWKRVHIKSTGLLPNVLAKQAAIDSGADEAWLMDAEERITEGSSTNAFIISADGVLATHPGESGILRGITRHVVLEVAAAHGLVPGTASFTRAEARRAREAFLSSSNHRICPVVAIDGAPVGDGQPGPVTRALMKRLDAAIVTHPFGTLC